MADELWRFVLYSEFAFDLPCELPESLGDVPRAVDEARPLVEDLCDRLRGFDPTKSLYIARAEAIERELDLPTACQGIEDLGVRDTFPFEERSFFGQAVDALKRDNIDKLRRMLDRHTHSVWVGRGENQAQWQLLQGALSLIEACEDAERQLPDYSRSQEDLIDFYISSLREVDRLQREFEQAECDLLIQEDGVEEVVPLARDAYRKLIDKVQRLFVGHLEKSGWPPAGRLANADVFDKLIAPKIQESGRRVALLLIDALRYELGVELQKHLAEDGQVEMQAAFAQLPTIAPVGMASLLPEAGSELKLLRRDDRVGVALGDQDLPQATQRLDVLRRRYGQRFAEMPLADFVRSKASLSKTVELLVIRSNDMDEEFESDLEIGLSRVSHTIQRVIAAIHKLRTLGFHDALIVTDHGFYLNTGAQPGNVCSKPPGNWIGVHDRMLLGEGVDDPANFVVPAQSVSVRGDFSKVAGPRALVAYRAGQQYLHGGASLEEAVVPVIAMRLQTVEEKAVRQPTVSLSYKRGAKKITTRLPVIEIVARQGDLFSTNTMVEILLEAQDKKGSVVGEAKPGGAVNSATRTVSLRPGATEQVTLKMDLEFEGKFTVKALDPTTLTIFSKIDLETDYTV